MKFLFFFLVGSIGGFAADAPPTPESDAARLDTVHVRSTDASTLKRAEILKTEVIRKETIEHKRAQTLADAVSNQVGVDAQNSCANCGSKRITINGLRGEHTTILIDGVPMHSAVSSFYGMDAIPTVGIDSIEVSRGAGASLIAPEAIGGVVNIITAKATETGIKVEGSLGNAATGLTSVLGTVVGGQGKYRLVFAGQLSHQGHWDVDGNQVSEAPDLSNQSFFVKAGADLDPANKIEARYARQTVSILGGTVDGTRPTTFVTGAGQPAFTGSDVSQRYLDAQNRLADVVNLGRHEAMLRWNSSVSQALQFQATLSAAEQKQNSIYMHGYDYRNRDWVSFGDARAIFSMGESHFLTGGVQFKNQDMVSSSDKLYANLGLPSDSFVYESRAAYLQDVWLIGESVELSSALRLDNMRVNWRSQTAKEFEIDQLMVAPRVNLKLTHSPAWTSRLMYGRGYRPPLSFFESQHGLNESGFVVQITDTEKSHGLGYSLAYERPGLSITGSSHYTWLSQMAYAEGNVPFPDPAVFRNSAAESRLWSNDIVLSYDVQPNWSLQLSYERFWMNDEYKSLLPAAAMEQRIRLVSDFHWGDWEFVNTFTWSAARDLSKYGYRNHYRTYTNELIDPGDPLLGTQDVVGAGKNQFAPPFLVWDIYVAWKVRKQVSFFASVQNVLDYTQTGYGDSPLNWSAHNPSDPAHFHLDNNHTWGPLRGRVFSVGLKAEI